MIIKQLRSGGVITNYNCTSKCAHCLYNCSPKREKAAISPESAGRIFDTIRSMGCASVHIGGGEPMLNFQILLEVANAARKAGVSIDYVETNSSWFKARESAVEWLTALKGAGVGTLLVSISPFHNEHIPFAKIKGVMSACRDAGIRVFPWIDAFLSDLSRFDENRPHAFEEYTELFGETYLHTVLQRYWIHMGGRALSTFRPMLPGLTAKQVLLKYARFCRNDLSDTSHFHVDLYENYIPGLCAGLAFPARLLGQTLDANKYPVLSLLWDKGIRGLFEWAEKEHGFTPRQDAYVNKCDLCNVIRSYLVDLEAGDFAELSPVGYYEEMRKPQ